MNWFSTLYFDGTISVVYCTVQYRYGIYILLIIRAYGSVAVPPKPMKHRPFAHADHEAPLQKQPFCFSFPHRSGGNSLQRIRSGAHQLPFPVSSSPLLTSINPLMKKSLQKRSFDCSRNMWAVAERYRFSTSSFHTAVENRARVHEQWFHRTKENIA